MQRRDLDLTVTCSLPCAVPQLLNQAYSARWWCMFFARAGKFIHARPALRRAATALFFAPIPFTATYYYTVKQVNGISMQVNHPPPSFMYQLVN